MKNIVFILIISSIFSSYSKVLAQNNCTQPYQEQRISGDLFIPYAMQYLGSPYFNEEWFDGSVKLTSGASYNKLKLRYDIFKDHILYYNANIKRVVVIDDEIVSDFWIQKENLGGYYHLKKLQINDTTLRSGFYFELLSDSISLYMKTAKFIDSQNSMNPSDDKLGSFYTKTTFFFMVNQQIHHVILRKRKLAKQFPKNQQQIVRYISKNHLSVKNAEHLRLIFIEINRLSHSTNP
jgi:hypothetical protein